MDNSMYHKISTDNFSTAYEICKLFETFDDIVFGVDIQSTVKFDELIIEFIITFSFEVGDDE